MDSACMPHAGVLAAGGQVDNIIHLPVRRAFRVLTVKIRVWVLMPESPIRRQVATYLVPKEASSKLLAQFHKMNWRPSSCGYTGAPAWLG